MARIFISYSRVDRRFVDDIVPLLRKVYGLSHVWFDEEILGGRDWWDEILNQIADCDVFVYLLTDRSVGSPYCRAEYMEADRLRKAILPVLIRARTDIPSDLSRIEYVDLSGGVKDVEALTKLYASINQLLGSVPRRPKKPRWPERTPLPNVQPSTIEATAKPEERVSFPPKPVVTEKSRKKRLQERWSGWSVEIRAIPIALLSAFAIILCGLIVVFGPSSISEVLGPSASKTPTAGLASTSISPSGPPQMPTSKAIPTVSGPAPTDAFRPAETSSGFSLVVKRYGDIVSICGLQADDLGKLEIDFGKNEVYPLSDIFTASVTTGMHQCWCLRQSTSSFPLPLGCDHTQTLKKVGEDWRNATINLNYAEQLVGPCSAQPDNLGEYSCEFRVN